MRQHLYHHVHVASIPQIAQTMPDDKMVVQLNFLLVILLIALIRF